MPRMSQNRRRTKNNQNSIQNPFRSRKCEDNAAKIDASMILAPSISQSLQLSPNLQSGINNYEDDRVNLLSTFPEEIWLYVLDKAEHPDTLKLLSSSSPFFRKILLPRRVEFMFHDVIKVLEKHEKKKLKICERACKGHCNLPQHFSGPFCFGILKLRLICRSWCLAIDNFYQHHPLRLQFRRQPFFESTTEPTWMCFSVSRLDQARSFLLDLESLYQGNVKSPFFGKSIAIGFSVAEEEQEACFLETLQKILVRYGDQIWYCVLNPLNEFFFYAHLAALLKLMPNLKALHIDAPRYSVSRFDKEELQQLDFIIKSSPLPTLVNLQLLTMKHLSAPIFKELVRSNGQVSSLFGVRSHYHLDRMTLPNLKRLAFEKITVLQDFARLFSPQAFRNTETLHLNFRGLSGIWERMLCVLSKNLKNSLKHLVINVSSEPHDFGSGKLHQHISSRNLKAYIPHLTHLKLSMENFANLDFILPLRNFLNDLHVEVKWMTIQEMENQFKTTKVEKGNLLKIFSCSQGSKLESNILKTFPRLQAFRFIFPERSMEYPYSCVFRSKSWYLNKKTLVHPPVGN